MKRSLASPPPLWPRHAVAAGCGGSDEIPADAVASSTARRSRGRPSTTSSRAPRRPTAQKKRAFPKAGSAEYQALQHQAAVFPRPAGRVRARPRRGHRRQRRRPQKQFNQVKHPSSSGDRKNFDESQKAGVQDAKFPGGAPRRSSSTGSRREGDRGRQGHRRGRSRSDYDQNKAHYTVARVARGAAHPRQDEGPGRPDPRPAHGAATSRPSPEVLP